MGSGRWTTRDWSTYSTAKTAGKRTEEVFNSISIDADLNPYGIKIRESCDSNDNPNSNAVIIALDVTGSMTMVLDNMARKGLNTLVTEIYNRKPLPDPHIMCMGIGDVECDKSPLQTTQFEADIRIADQLTKIWLERGGGGNNYESYALAWYFAAFHTSIDCFTKRGKKGYLFTIGDEGPTPSLSKEVLHKFIGDSPERDYSGEELLRLVSKCYNVFHVMVEEGSYFRQAGDWVAKQWSYLLGERAIRLADHTKFAEVVVSAIQVCEGASHAVVVDSWDSVTTTVVQRAITPGIRGLITDR
jgi:hypothetical protein